MNRLTKSLCLVIISAATFSGCTTYTTKGGNLKVFITHEVQGDQLRLSAKILNSGSSSVTIINNHNYYTLSLKAVHKDQGGYPVKGCILFEEPGPSEFVRLAPGKAITMDEPFRLKRLSNGEIEIFSPMLDDEKPAVHGRNPLLEAKFSYWGGREIPFFARIGLVNVYVGDLEAKTTFRPLEVTSQSTTLAKSRKN